MAQFPLCASTILWKGHQMHVKVRKNLHIIEILFNYLTGNGDNLSEERRVKGLFYRNLPLVLTVSGTRDV
jgi:hypothetical protein